MYYDIVCRNVTYCNIVKDALEDIDAGYNIVRDTSSGLLSLSLSIYIYICLYIYIYTHICGQPGHRLVAAGGLGAGRPGKTGHNITQYT